MAHDECTARRSGAASPAAAPGCHRAGTDAAHATQHGSCVGRKLTQSAGVEQPLRYTAVTAVHMQTATTVARLATCYRPNPSNANASNREVARVATGISVPCGPLDSGVPTSRNSSFNHIPFYLVHTKQQSGMGVLLTVVPNCTPCDSLNGYLFHRGKYAQGSFNPSPRCLRRAQAGTIRSSLYGRKGVTNQTAVAAAGDSGPQKK